MRSSMRHPRGCRRLERSVAERDVAPVPLAAAAAAVAATLETGLRLFAFFVAHRHVGLETAGGRTDDRQTQAKADAHMSENQTRRMRAVSVPHGTALQKCRLTQSMHAVGRDGQGERHTAS